MAQFLIDNNLPYRLSYWKSEDYEFVHNINPNLSDADIWEYAKEKNLTIVTKDTDFTNRILTVEPPPRVIHFIFGNMSLKEFHTFLNLHWGEILKLSKKNKLVTVYKERVEAIQ